MPQWQSRLKFCISFASYKITFTAVIKLFFCSYEKYTKRFTVIDLMHWRHKGSHLHNNDASLVSRSAHVLCWQCALALSLSVRGPGRASPAVWLAGFAPLAACLAMTHVAVFRLTPNAAGRPSVTSYAYGLLLSDLSLLTCCYHMKMLNYCPIVNIGFFANTPFY